MTTLRVAARAAAALVVLLVAADGRSNELDPAVAAIKKAWDSRAQTVRTVRLRWDDRYTVAPGAYGGQPARKTTYDNWFSVTIDGDDVRFEGRHVILDFKDEIVPQERARVWSGEQFKEVLYAGAVPYARGHLVKSIYLVYPWGDVNLRPLLATYRPFHGGLGLFEDFARRFHVVSGEHFVEGRRSVLLRDRPPRKGKSVTSVYLDPDRDFTVLRLMIGEGKDASVTTFHEHRQVNGAWVPVRWTSKEVGSVTESTLAECSVNEPVGPQAFELPFPPGTWVTDPAEPNMYIVKEDGHRRPITDKELTSGRGQADFLRTETGTFGPDVEAPATKIRRQVGAVRAHQLVALKTRHRWSVLVARDDGLDVYLAASGDPDADVTALAEGAIDDASGRRLIFGKGRDEHEARALLARWIRDTIGAIDRACKLTPPQMGKLELAGRGDIERFFKRVDGLKAQLQCRYDELAARRGELDDALERLFRETRPLRHILDTGDLGDDSLFTKTLKVTLTPEQAAAYEAANGRAKRATDGDGKVDTKGAEKDER